ncbi:MAG: glycosyltransferase family 4 protein [Bryobacteraceae bacterium]
MSALQALGGAAATTLERVSPVRRPRLLYLVTRAEHGGAQAHVLGLAIGMSGTFDVEVATGEEGFLTEACRERGITVHLVPHLNREIRPFEDLRGFGELMKLMRRTQPDIVHAHTFKAGFLGRFAARRLKIPCVYTVHMWPFGSAVPLSWRWAAPVCERLAAGWCDRIITVSKQGAETAAKHRICDSSRVISIWTGIPDHPARARLDHGRDLSCTMVARFTHFKDHALLLKAFSRVPGKTRLVLVGDGDTLPAAKKLAERAGIGERVEFAGARSDVPELLAQTDLFILASKQETLPISILEAMRAGLPVIASDVGGISEEVIDGETGLLVPSGSVEALSAALERLLSDKMLRTAMGRAGRRRFENMFLADAMIERTGGLYEEVLENRSARR